MPLLTMRKLVNETENNPCNRNPPSPFPAIVAYGSPVLLPPESLVRAHSLPLKRAELQRLESKLSEVSTF